MDYFLPKKIKKLSLHKKSAPEKCKKQSKYTFTYFIINLYEITMGGSHDSVRTTCAAGAFVAPRSSIPSPHLNKISKLS